MVQSSPAISVSDDVEKRMGGLDLNNASERAQLDLSSSNLEFISDLGAGNGGTVTKVKHKPTGILMAKKVVFIDTKPETRKQILRELQILHECHSDYIVGFYGAYLSDVNIYMCMEFMDVGSFDSIYSKHGPIDVAVCGKVVVTVIHGLSYLYESFRIIHRDVKPSNILVNRRGQIKLCDFGVSGELINSIADTFVGTSTYMGPERIQGAQYSIKSDVWSLGITMIELAHGSFPFALDYQDDPDATTRAVPRVQEVRSLSILELLQHIVFEPPPQLNPDPRFPPCMVDFVNRCLCKDPQLRPTPMELRQHPFVQQSIQNPVDLQGWVRKAAHGLILLDTLWHGKSHQNRIVVAIGDFDGILRDGVILDAWESHVPKPFDEPKLDNVEEQEDERFDPVLSHPEQDISLSLARRESLGSPTKLTPTITHKKSITTQLNKMEERIFPGLTPMSVDEARTHCTTIHDMLQSKMAAFVGQLHIFEDVVLASAFQNLVDTAHECVVHGHNLSALVHSISALSQAIWAPPDAFGHLKEAQKSLDKVLAQFASIQNLSSSNYVPMEGSSHDHRNKLTQLASSMIKAANMCLVAVFSVLDIAAPTTVVQIWRPANLSSPGKRPSHRTLQLQEQNSESRAASASLTELSSNSMLSLPDTSELTHEDSHKEPSASLSELGLTGAWAPPSVRTVVEPFGDGILARSEEGRILGGDMIGILSSLCKESQCCSSDLVTLLQNFRVFCTPEDLLALVLDQFGKAASDAGRRCLCRLLYTWVSQHWYAPLDAAVLPDMLSFAQKPACKLAQSSTMSLSSACNWRLRQRDEEFPSDPRFHPSLPVFEGKKMSRTISHRLITTLRQKKVLWDIEVLDFDPGELARQITLRESTLFSQITIHELLNRHHDYKDTNYHSKAIHVKEMSLLSTQITNWLGECILRERDLKRRSQKLRFFIVMALEALDLGNYNLVMALLGGLNLSTIGRLKNTWAGVTARKKAKLEKLCKVFEASRNFRTYRTLLRSRQGPTVPFLGLILTDITFCCSGNAVMRTFPSCSEPLINFGRCHMLSNIFQDMKRFQRVYPIEPIPEVQNFLQQVLEQGSDYTPGDYPTAMECMYQRSLALEPRDAMPDALSSVRKGNVMTRTFSAFLNTHGSSSVGLHEEKGPEPMSRTSSSGSASSVPR
ncbi:mitogen-activated protein kinase kinase [Malassezia caprae]|uniref:Mitogen-activated protein kinase kinase n=1 Tax=Malassezia caprae TaxID=1381934 RepID=A0AAF0EF51_9BASI|nr:mitogen-activated protein kinase kinase [Malassezia caprae]